MPAEQARLVTAGRVGRPHGLDGTVAVGQVVHDLAPGTVVTVAGRELRVTGRRGASHKPLVRLEGIDDREAAAALSGELLLVSEHESPLEEGEWLAEDLIGCRVEGIGEVRRVLPAPSCDVLECDDGTLVPLVADAVRRVSVDERRIEVDLAFLGREEAG